MTRIFTGLQPTGTLHIGNYFASILQWNTLVNSINDAEALLSIVDLHAITVKQDPVLLKQRIYELAAVMLASGADYKKHMIFPQSMNPDHTYVGWLFTCLTPMSWLDKMTQFKEKKVKLEGYKEAVSTGLYAYPTLMAADILLYDTDLVPVGADQKQHVELTCDVANRFNSFYGETFKIPEFRTTQETTKIYDLQEPTKKMSKSDKDDAGRIALTDTPEQIRKKFSRAVTDSENVVAFDYANKPGISNLLSIMSAATGRAVTDLAQEYESKGYGVFKNAVAEAVIEFMQPIQAKISSYLNDKAELDGILKNAADRAFKISHPKVLEITAKMGLYIHE